MVVNYCLPLSTSTERCAASASVTLQEGVSLHVLGGRELSGLFLSFPHNLAQLTNISYEKSYSLIRLKFLKTLQIKSCAFGEPGRDLGEEPGCERHHFRPIFKHDVEPTLML